MLSIPMVTEENASQMLSGLKLIPGVVDAQLGVKEKTAYLRVDPENQPNQKIAHKKTARKFDEDIFNQSIQEVLQQWQKGH